MSKSNTTDEKKCPKCNGDGYYIIKEGLYEFTKWCECGQREQKILENQLKFAYIPEKYKDASLDNYNLELYEGMNRKIIERAFAIVKCYMENFDKYQEEGKGLYLYSTCKGSGKTRLALSLANEIIKRKKIPVKFATSVTILNEIKDSWNRDSNYTESKLLDNLISTPVLIIDDFGTEKAKEWVTEKFYSIINGRYNDKKITIFTSNYDLNTIEYDGRITDRIDENCFKVAFPNTSIRKIKASENDDFMKQFL